MSLLNPTLGEVIDRLTILALKRLHHRAEGKDVAHFDREWAGLHTKLRARSLEGKIQEALLDLAAINAALWTRTETMRLFASHAVEFSISDGCDLGIAILRLNDQRAALVQQINQLSGEFEGPEK